MATQRSRVQWCDCRSVSSVLLMHSMDDPPKSGKKRKLAERDEEVKLRQSVFSVRTKRIRTVPTKSPTSASDDDSGSIPESPGPNVSPRLAPKPAPQLPTFIPSLNVDPGLHRLVMLDGAAVYEQRVTQHADTPS